MRDLGFALNDKDFSDRILNLQLIRNHSDSDSDSYDSQNSNKKQKTEASTKTDASCEESSSFKVETLHINSAVLASRSPFFYKLFKNGMKESQEKNVTLKINLSEERAFMDLLNFIYTKKVSASSVHDLLAVLMLADKFEVSSCTSYCSKQLERMHMSLESALLYLEIPSTVLVCEAVQSLVDSAKKYLLRHYDEIFKVEEEQEEVLALPLSAIEVVLGGELRVGSEDDVYEFILRWGRAHYPKRRERRQIVTNLISRFILFPYLGMSTLKKMQESPDFDTKQVSNLMIESLYLNAGYPIGERYCVPRAMNQLLRRDYYELPIKETHFGSCHVVYFNLRREWCDSIDRYIAEGDRYSQIFFLGGQSFRFSVEKTPVSSDEDEDRLGLFLHRTEGNNGTCSFDYELEVQTFSHGTWELESIDKFENCNLSVGQRVGSEELFEIPWIVLVESSKYFVNQILHLRAQFDIKNSLPIS